MNRNKRRHKTGFGYIGAGNNTSVFNRKPEKVFSKIKKDLNNKSIKNHKLKFTDKKLSKVKRKEIKDRIRKENKQKNRLTLILSLVILIPLTLLIRALIESVLAKYR